jgi:DNA gyrase subunit B
VIERGYLYIAQPPLFSVKKGSGKMRYLKDERALDTWLMNNGVDDCTLTLADGRALTGSDLMPLLEEAAALQGAIETLARHAGSRNMVEQAAVLGFQDVSALAVRLNNLAGSEQWTPADMAENPAGSLAVTQRRYGVSETYRLSAEQLASSEARKLAEHAAYLKAHFEKPARLITGKGEQTIAGPLSLLSAVLERGRQGVAIQRYKGLGEMNPEQLWETTLDPQNRTLLQVKLSHLDDAEQIFSTLMGDVVEPRREFIQSNALAASNIDA